MTQETPKFPAAPTELGDAGRLLWDAVGAIGDGELELRPDELAILGEACATRDVIAALAESVSGAPAMVEGSRNQQVVNPAFAELRQQRQLLASLLKALGIPDPVDGEEWDNLNSSQRARKAARKRWDG